MSDEKLDTEGQQGDKNWNLEQVRWTGSGKISGGETTSLYSGPEDAHQRKVGLVLSKEAARALIGWNPVKERIITARLQSRHAKTTIVSLYAPTEDTDDEDKDTFYQLCEDVLNNIPSHNIVLFAGDMNAQIGNNRARLEHTIGPHGSATETNDNGERLLLFCNINGLCIGNIYFAHKKSIRRPRDHQITR
uniref:Endonuclease/exonuclease/phosphatase domain-containing protein n=1 Tax=Octopus bimaculoides TaxID=37653 RepID=A0A0L8HBL2_OCTBM